MRVVINRFLTLSAQNVSEEVLWALGLVYLILVLVTLGSILCLKVNAAAKVAWAVLVVGLPVVGMALYCLRCLAVADYSFLGQFGIKLGSRKSLSKMATPPRV